MRQFVLAIIILNSALGFCQEAEFFVKKAIHKFPKTTEGVVLKHHFELENTGDAPLILSDYKVECDCTVLTVPEHPIQPGEIVQLKVTFDTSGKYYFQDRRIIVYDNTKKKSHELRIKVNVIPLSL